MQSAESKKKSSQVYQSRLAQNKSDKLYVDILQKLSIEKRYRDPKYTARQLGIDLNVDTRYIAAAIASHSNGENYCSLVNSLRLREACRMLRSPRFAEYTIEEIGLTAGYASRQAFYFSFQKKYGVTPRQYRIENASASELSDDED